MRAIGRVLVLFVLLFTLVACGGSSSGKSKDTTAPAITLTGNNPQVIEAGNNYVEQGATATDNRDGDLSSAIVIDASQVDTSAPGTYVVTYNVSDSAGNSSATVSRTVVCEDTTLPVITLLGGAPQIIVAGNPYIELGATASDTLDGDLSANVVIDATAVDTMAAGEYAVTYDVTDAAGNPAVAVTRTVRVELPPPPSAPEVSVEGDIKQLIFSWDDVADADYYRLMENPDGHSGFGQVGDDVPRGTLSATRDIAVHLHDWVNALYLVQACNVGGCTGSAEVGATDFMLDTIGFFKASNTDALDHFSYAVAVALSGDGNTLAVGAQVEDSSATGINGDQADNSANAAGAVYLFRFDGTEWTQQAYIKASNTDAKDRFGDVVALSADGNTLAVGAQGEASGATGINGDQVDNSAERAGAVYLFRFDGTHWAQQAYIKASNTDATDGFGGSVTLSADGNTLAVGAQGEASGATGINGDQADNSAGSAGAVYLFQFDGTNWSQQAYIKASDNDAGISFGYAVALSGDGNTLAVGAPHAGCPLFCFGAVYVFRYDGLNWTQQANQMAFRSYWDLVGSAIALSADGNRLAVGVKHKDNIADPTICDQYDCSDEDSGAVYTFRWDGADWTMQAYITATNADAFDSFGGAVALSADGNTLAVGATPEASSATGINGDQADNSANAAGAAYLFRYDGIEWTQQAYIKASNTDAGDGFGDAVALSADGNTLAVGAYREDSNAIGINGDQDDNSAENAGAVYVY